MIDTILCDGKDKLDGLENNADRFNFNKSLLESQGLDDCPLPKGFKYDFDGSILCEEDLFTDEDYQKDPSPIDNILGGKIKEGEYRAVDYSGCEKENISTMNFIKDNNGRIITIGNENHPVLLPKGTRIVPPNNGYMKLIGNEGIDNISEKMDIIQRLSQYHISFSDLKTFFGEDKNDTEILDILKNINLDDDIDEYKKKQIFGEYLDQLKSLNILEGLILITLKAKVGNILFSKYIGNFISKVEDDKEFLGCLITYLCSPYCKITKDNMDEYLDFVIKFKRSRNVNLGNCNLENAKLICKYAKYDLFMVFGGINYDGVSEAKIEQLKNFENSGITGEMLEFARFKSIARDFTLSNVEELFISEKEGKNLFYFLSKYPQKLQNLGGKIINEIDLNTENRNFCFRGILEMMKSMGDMEVLPYPGENADDSTMQKRKNSWERVVKQYERLLRNYISLDKDEKGKEIPRKQTFDKIFYSMAIPEEDWNGAFKDSLSKEQLQLFSKNKVLDYSSKIDEKGNLDQTNQKKLVEDLCEYAAADQHKNEKILVFIGAHGGKNGESGNGWTKDDWLKISKYPNVKIMSTRCYFGKAYSSENNETGDYIYDQQSQLSGFSNNTTSLSGGEENFQEGLDVGLGFHELELFVRLKYGLASPLTEQFEVIDGVTGEKKNQIIGLSYVEQGDTFGDNT